MIAYNQTVINNISIIKKVRKWYAVNLLKRDQLELANKKYFMNFYSPNVFVKIGLFIFTLFAILALLGLFAAFFFTGYSTSQSEKLFFIVSSIIFTIACIFFLENFIKTKMLYRSGVDEALLYSAIVFLYSALYFIINYVSSRFIENDVLLLLLLIIFPFVALATIRYIDTLVTIITLFIFYTICFLFILKIGDIAKLILPFAMMILSILIYCLVKKQQLNSKLIGWKNGLITCEAITMIVFYLAGNYFVIRESSVAFFNLELSKGEDVPLAVLFYVFTAIVPLTYIYSGLKRKNKVSLWIGLLLVTLSAFTFKYYFSLGHPEISLTIAGIIMIVIAYISIHYLKSDKYGITFIEEIDEDNFLKTNAEALAIVQTFSHTGDANQQTEQTDTDAYGGGDFGGAGSGDNF